MEFATPNEGDNHVKTGFKGIAFEPTGGADETASELTRRNIAHGEVENRLHQGSDGQVRKWALLDLKDIPPTGSDIFFVDYKFRKAVADKYDKINSKMVASRGGPLGITGVAEIAIGVRDIREARRKWGALLAPAPRILNDAFDFDIGPAIRLVRTKSPGINGIVLRVNSLNIAEKFLEDHGWLLKDKAGQIAISPDVIEGLSIKLVEASVVK
jgi:hypothetical protein